MAVKNTALKYRVSVEDYMNPGNFKSNPTIAAGDFKIDKDGGGFNNLTNLPTVSPAGSITVLIDLTATEMNADVVTIIAVDQTSPKEWSDGTFCLITTAS